MNPETMIAGGNTAEIYLRDQKVIKLFKRRCPAGEARQEAEKQRLAFSLGLPVPRVYDVTEVNGRQAIVMEHIPGTPIGVLMRENMDRAGECLALSIEMQNRVHAVSGDMPEAMALRLADRIRLASGLDDAVREALLRRLESLPRDNRLCHGDFHVLNLLQAEDRVVIIDWVDSTSGSACADICRTYLIYTQYMPELAEEYLRMYCEKFGYKREEILTWMPVIAAARLAEGMSPEENRRLLQIIGESL